MEVETVTITVTIVIAILPSIFIFKSKTVVN